MSEEATVKNKLRPIDVARQFDRSVAWLRTLERSGVIPPAQRDELSGARVYSPEDVEQIREAVLTRRSHVEASV